MLRILRPLLSRLSLLALGIIMLALLTQIVHAANVNVEVGNFFFGGTPSNAWDDTGNPGTFELVTANEAQRVLVGASSMK